MNNKQITDHWKTSARIEPSALDLAQARFKAAILGCVSEIERIVIPAPAPRVIDYAAIQRDARLELQLAELAWHAELEFAFGEATESRYTSAGRAMPGFLRYERARRDWERVTTGRSV